MYDVYIYMVLLSYIYICAVIYIIYIHISIPISP